MKKNYLTIKLAFGICIAAISFTACSDSDPTPDTTGKTKYVLMTMSDRTSQNKPGFVTAFDEFPTGNISNVTTTSLQGSGMGGMRPYNNWLFTISGTANYEKGIERLAIAEDGRVSVGGILLTDQSTFGSGNFVIENETNGFYWDGGDPLKLQTFNPTTLGRTGDIDFSAAVNERGTDEDGILFRSIGQKFLAIKGGKLYANITYARTNGTQKGFFDDFYPDVYIAVIDLATRTHEKTITIEGTGSIAYINENRMYDFDTNGDLYVVCQGRNALGTDSKIARIKANETDIDATWELKFSEYNPSDEGKFVGVFAKDGRLVLVVNTVPLTGGPTGNINAADIWKFYTVDVASKTFTEITGIPAGTNPGAAQAVEEVDGKILLRGSTLNESDNGYYELNGTAATRLFNVTEGGSVTGFYKIELP